MKTINNFINEKLKITKTMLNINNKYNGYEFVDLCLPSGTLWAKCNVGAKTETEYGDYFAWGETKTKKKYDWSTYKYCEESFEELTKYCSNKVFGHDMFTDNITQLESEDDAAHVNMGGKWCIPTQEQFKELLKNTTHKFIKNYNDSDINGVLFISKHNDNTIFLPAGGFIYEDRLITNTSSAYWSCVNDQTSPDDAFCLYFQKNELHFHGYSRSDGIPIRPVLNK